MSDSAFKTAAYPGYTLAQLRAKVATFGGNPVMRDEIARREAVATGDVTRMTGGERLRHVRANA